MLQMPPRRFTDDVASSQPSASASHLHVSPSLNSRSPGKQPPLLQRLWATLPRTRSSAKRHLQQTQQSYRQRLHQQQSPGPPPAPSSTSSLTVAPMVSQRSALPGSRDAGLQRSGSPQSPPARAARSARGPQREAGSPGKLRQLHYR